MPRKLHRLLTGGKKLYIWRDTFNVDVPAGSLNGSVVYPGRADGVAMTRTVTDTENKLSVSGGQLVCAGGKATPVGGDPGGWYGAEARVVGKALYGIFTTPSSTSVIFMSPGFDFTSSGYIASSIIFNTKLYITSSNIDSNLSYQTNAKYKTLIIQTTTGHLYYVKGGSITDWTLLYIDTQTPTYPGIANQNAAFTVDEMRLIQLPAPFNTDYGIATQRLAGARSAGDTWTAEGNFFKEWTATTIANGQQMAVRLQDNDNYWRVDAAADGSIALQEVVNTTATPRGSGAAGSIANGQRMVVISDGSTIKVYANNVLKITYASATNFQTATGGKLIALGTGGAISDIVSYPLRPSGTALSVINKYTR